MHRKTFRTHALTLAVAGALLLPAAASALAGTTCQLLDAGGNDIGDGGADAGSDLGGQANATACGKNAKATSAAATAFGYDAQATGIGSVAVGVGTRATESMALAAGNSANASGIWSVALGQNSTASNWGAIGLGSRSLSSGLFSTAVGMASQATGSSASAFGGFLGTTQDSLEAGRYTQAIGNASSAFGAAAHAMASRSSAFGANSQVTAAATGSVALGADAVAAEANVVSLGHAAGDLDNLGTAYGSDLDRRLVHLADGVADTDGVNVRQLNAALVDAGSPYVAANADAVFGYDAPAQSTGSYSIAIGSNSVAGANGTNFSIALGGGSQSLGYSSLALGAGTTVTGFGATAIGAQANTAGAGAVAIGSSSVANEDLVVSFGHSAGDTFDDSRFGGGTGTYTEDQNRRLIHVAAGIGDTDAVNVQQLNSAIAGVATDLSPVAAAFGGGASWSGSVFGAPSYSILGSNYDNVGDAFAAIDGWMQDNANGVQYDDAGKTQVTLQGGDGTQVKNLADGVDATDAVNKGQMEAGDATALASANAYTDGRETAIRTDMAAGDTATLASANTYTDGRETAIRTDMAAGDAATLTSANAHADAGDAATLSASQAYADDTAAQALTSARTYTDTRFNQAVTQLSDSFDAFRGEVGQRFRQMDRRLDQVAAMGSAYAGMAMNTAGLAGANRIGVGFGAQGGRQAMAVGYQRVIGNRASVSLGAAIGGGEKSMSAGAGFSW